MPRELPAASPAGLARLRQYLYSCTSRASKLECSTCTSARPTWIEARPLPPPSPHLRQYLYFCTSNTRKLEYLLLPPAKQVNLEYLPPPSPNRWWPK